VVVELKSVESVAPVHKRILLTYIRLMDKRIGLLMNFGAEVLKDGITRIVNNF
jgi:GxxExxY protein